MRLMRCWIGGWNYLSRRRSNFRPYILYITPLLRIHAPAAYRPSLDIKKDPGA